MTGLVCKAIVHFCHAVFRQKVQIISMQFVIKHASSSDLQLAYPLAWYAGILLNVSKYPSSWPNITFALLLSTKFFTYHLLRCHDVKSVIRVPWGLPCSKFSFTWNRSLVATTVPSFSSWNSAIIEPSVWPGHRCKVIPGKRGQDGVEKVFQFRSCTVR
jgi:hypothetical protein